ncbi:RNA-guided endonuclease InsQ/TnpB family protein [Streptomyces sp. NPDC002962]|uniref:RNA-guided endonuclease InsQ/TnpB family protein n=1 Tax=Streptomyces sp. NPDC002962 TaxID=3364674 RepID=UPI0036AE1018
MKRDQRGQVREAGVQYRFYPTAEQAAELSRTFGCVRKVYNMALDARSRAWTLEHRRISYVETSAMLTEWKKTDAHGFPAQVSSVPLQQSLRHLQSAYSAFFDKRARHPRFKSKKRSKASAEYTRSAFRFRHGELVSAKMHDPLAIVWSRPLPEGAEPSTVTVSGDEAGRWFVTTRLVRENRTIVIEDLTVRGLLGNRTLARAISDASWTESRSLLEYKCAWYGRELIAVDRFFPSSKTCSACGLIRDELPLNVRRWTCEGCGTHHDRDHNAAKIILAAGLAVSACGAGVRPQRSSSGQAVGNETGSVMARAVTAPPRRGRGPGQSVIVPLR